VDPANGDFPLQPGSPCIDAGDLDQGDLPETDFEGDMRAEDGDGDGEAGADMGADEWVEAPGVMPRNLAPVAWLLKKLPFPMRDDASAGGGPSPAGSWILIPAAGWGAPGREGASGRRQRIIPPARRAIAEQETVETEAGDIPAEAPQGTVRAAHSTAAIAAATGRIISRHALARGGTGFRTLVPCDWKHAPGSIVTCGLLTLAVSEERARAEPA
jgi:hypothetical protein